MFIGLLTSIVNGSNHIKCVSLSNQKCMIQPTLINLYPNEYTEELHYYPFAVSKTEDSNLSVFKMITCINELKTLTKHVSCECKCKFDGRKCNWNLQWNNDRFRYEWKIII